MSLRYRTRQSTPPYSTKNRTPADHTLGESAYPGCRLYGHRPENIAYKRGVAAGAVINLGEVVTKARLNQGDNPATGATETDFVLRAASGWLCHPQSAAATGAGIQWGDCQGGAWTALNYVDNTARADNAQDVEVYARGAKVVLIGDAGIEAGFPVGLDFRTAGATARADRAAAVAWDHNNLTGATPDYTLFMRVREMSDANLADSTVGKAFVGTVSEIVPVNTNGTEKEATAYNDLVVVELGVGRP